MANYAKVDVRIWNDRKVKSLSPIQPCGQGLWIHLLVSEHRTSLPGVLRVGESALAEELGWSLEAFREAFREASSKGMVKADWKARFVWIPNACEYNRPESPNVVKSWRIPWDEAPECDLKTEAYWRLKAFMEGFAEGFRKAFAKACPEPSPNQEQEQEQDQDQEQRSPSARVRDPGDPVAQEPAQDDVPSVPVDGELLPDTPDRLQSCLKAAMEKRRPERGMYVPGPFWIREASELLRSLGDVAAAAPEVLRRIRLFVADERMAPWTMKAFHQNYNAIGTVRSGRDIQVSLRTGHARSEDFDHAQVGEIKL